MKKIILLFTLSIATLSFSQTANKTIPWSGIITNNSGNVLTNAGVNVKFSITRAGTVIFSEQHSLTTDANGFVNADIGAGTPLINNLSVVHFDAVNLELKIEVDSGSGFITLSDDFFRAVPYAKGAETSRELANDDEMIILNPANISFYTNGYQGEINENGLKLTDLAGIGVREIVADADGQLQRKPEQAELLSVSGAAFTGKDFRFHPQFGLHQATNAPIIYPNLHYNVNLPNGAKITFIKIVYKDNAPEGFMFGLYRHNDTDIYGTSIYDMNSNDLAADPNWRTVSNGFTPVNHIVDNVNNSYYLSIYSTSWPSGQNLAIRRIVIYYRE